jgi:hypothetical protein
MKQIIKNHLRTIAFILIAFIIIIGINYTIYLTEKLSPEQQQVAITFVVGVLMYIFLYKLTNNKF